MVWRECVCVYVSYQKCVRSVTSCAGQLPFNLVSPLVEASGAKYPAGIGESHAAILLKFRNDFLIWPFDMCYLQADGSFVASWQPYTFHLHFYYARWQFDLQSPVVQSRLPELRALAISSLQVLSCPFFVKHSFFSRPCLQCFTSNRKVLTILLCQLVLRSLTSADLDLRLYALQVSLVIWNLHYVA